MCPLILRLDAKRRFSRSRSGTGDCAIAFGPDLHCQGMYPKSEIEWQAIQRLSEDKNIVLLYLAPGKFIVVPKRVCTSGQAEELRTILRQNVPELKKNPL